MKKAANTTPPRRQMKQQTLLAMNLTPTSHTDASTLENRSAKRVTRASTQQSPPPPSQRRTRNSPTRTTKNTSQAPQSPRLRPRRSTGTAIAGLSEPYDSYTIDMLRDECARRGISIQPRDPALGKRPQTKAQFIELLQEADMLSMFANKIKPRPGTKRAARAIDLSPSPSITRAPPSRRQATAPATATIKSPKKPSRQPAKAKANAESKPAASNPPSVSPAPVAMPVDEEGGSPPSEGRLRASEEAPPASEKAPPASEGETPASEGGPPVSEGEPPMIETTEPADTSIPVDSASAFMVDAVATLPITSPPPLQTEAQADSEPQPKPAVELKDPPAVKRDDGGVAARAVADAPSAIAERKGLQGTRARRGCRFRLINVLLSADFNERWDEMNSPVLESGGVNAFWRDVHLSYLCQNSVYDTLQSTDKLFKGVKPDVILNHSAQKLHQVWTDLVILYRRASNASSRSEAPASFFDSCAGRLDLMYLHLGLMEQPALQKTLVGDSSRVKARSVTLDAMGGEESETAQVASIHGSMKKSAKTKLSGGLVDQSCPPAHDRPRFVELQNPEMLPDWLIEDQKKIAAERGFDAESTFTETFGAVSAKAGAGMGGARSLFPPAPQSIALSQSPVQVPSSAVSDVVHSTDLVLHANAIVNADDEYMSSDYETGDRPTRGRAPQRRRSNLKRARKPSTDMAEASTSRELVAHPQKRMHTSTAVTTTMTRSQEITLPPDEFDVLHNRLRKINESIDQCYKTLSDGDAILNDMHREDVESDLRFYLGIKKRIQEQIVMFMHGY